MDEYESPQIDYSEPEYSSQSVANMTIQRLDNDVLEYLKETVSDDVIHELVDEIDAQPITMDCRQALAIVIKEQFSREYVVNNYNDVDLMKRWLELREKIIYLKARTRKVNHKSINYILSIIEGHSNNKNKRSSDKGFERKQQQTTYSNQSSTYKDDTRRIQEKSGISAIMNSGRRKDY